MLITTPSAGRFQRKRRPRKAPPALILVAATYTPGATPFVRLTFDRAINITAIDATAIVVDVQTSSTMYRGSPGSPTLFNPQTVQVSLAAFTMSTGSQILLTATAATRIAAGDGGLWSGVTSLPLPF